jgi:hypothetical protein
LTAGTEYFVKTVLGVDTFTVSATAGGAAINTTSAGSGTHKVAARYATRNVTNSFIDSGPIAKLREAVSWTRQFQVSIGVSHTVSIRQGNWDYGGGSNDVLDPVLMIDEAKR